MDAASLNEPYPVPSDGASAAHTNLASRGLPYGHGALATIPEASSSVSVDSCADDSSDSSGCSEMRYDKAILGPGYFTREDFLDYYGHDGIARWERATAYDSDASSDSLTISSCPTKDCRALSLMPPPPL